MRRNIKPDLFVQLNVSNQNTFASVYTLGKERERGRNDDQHDDALIVVSGGRLRAISTRSNGMQQQPKCVCGGERN